MTAFNAELAIVIGAVWNVIKANLILQFYCTKENKVEEKLGRNSIMKEIRIVQKKGEKY